MKDLKIFLFFVLLGVVLAGLILAGYFFMPSRFAFFQKTSPRDSQPPSEAWLTGSQGATSTEPEVQEPPLESVSHLPAPEIVQGLYYSHWTAGRKGFSDKIIKLASTTQLNSVVIDLKDFSGYLAFKPESRALSQYHQFKNFPIKDIDQLVSQLRKANVYLIGRITVFQDPILAKAEPQWAVQSKSKLGWLASSTDNWATSSLISKETLWLDNVDLAWIDPSCQEAWPYFLALAKGALGRGFDEINFDYIRFPSDGDLSDLYYPCWQKEKPKHEITREFFQYLSKNLPKAKLSVDVFGYTAVSQKDIGIGQVLEDAFLYFDFICPMVYPSHFALGFLGWDRPAEHPYEVIEHTLSKAKTRLDIFKTANPAASQTKIRPWLQDFDLGADYTAEMIGLEIKAVKDGLKEDYNGFMLWNSGNVYTEEALKSEF